MSARPDSVAPRINTVVPPSGTLVVGGKNCKFCENCAVPFCEGLDMLKVPLKAVASNPAELTPVAVTVPEILTLRNPPPWE